MTLQRATAEHAVNLRDSKWKEVRVRVRKQPGSGGVGAQPAKDPGQLDGIIPAQNLANGVW